MKKIIAFNWKTSPPSLNEAKNLFNFYLKNAQTAVIVCPPLIYLNEFQKLKTENKNLKLGAQNVFWKDKGYYTGEISPKMLKNLGVEYVIIGHSERRQILGETDEIVNKKVLVALKAGLKAILCVGEPLSIRKKGKKTIENFIKSQLQKNLKNIVNCKLKIENLIIAYEPIWAIGAGHSDTPQDAVEMINFIKTILNSKFHPPTGGLDSRVLYGGSVNGKNIKNFIKYKEIDGFLVGGASLEPKEIKNIIKETNEKINR